MLWHHSKLNTMIAYSLTPSYCPHLQLARFWRPKYLDIGPNIGKYQLTYLPNINIIIGISSQCLDANVLVSAKISAQRIYRHYYPLGQPTSVQPYIRSRFWKLKYYISSFAWSWASNHPHQQNQLLVRHPPSLTASASSANEVRTNPSLKGCWCGTWRHTEPLTKLLVPNNCKVILLICLSSCRMDICHPQEIGLIQWIQWTLVYV